MSRLQPEFEWEEAGWFCGIEGVESERGGRVRVDGVRGDGFAGTGSRGRVRGDGVRGDGVRVDGVRGDGVRGDGVRGDGVRGDGFHRRRRLHVSGRGADPRGSGGSYHPRLLCAGLVQAVGLQDGKQIRSGKLEPSARRNTLQRASGAEPNPTIPLASLVTTDRLFYVSVFFWSGRVLRLRERSGPMARGRRGVPSLPAVRGSRTWLRCLASR